MSLLIVQTWKADNQEPKGGSLLVVVHSCPFLGKGMSSVDKTKRYYLLWEDRKSTQNVRVGGGGGGGEEVLFVHTM